MKKSKLTQGNRILLSDVNHLPGSMASGCITEAASRTKKLGGKV